MGLRGCFGGKSSFQYGLDAVEHIAKGTGEAANGNNENNGDEADNEAVLNGRSSLFFLGKTAKRGCDCDVDANENESPR